MLVLPLSFPPLDAFSHNPGKRAIVLWYLFSVVLLALFLDLHYAARSVRVPCDREDFLAFDRPGAPRATLREDASQALDGLVD